MKNEKAKYNPGPSDIVRAFLNCENEDTRLNEVVQSASMELDWSDTPDKDREKAEAGAVALMLAAPELLGALALSLDIMERTSSALELAGDEMSRGLVRAAMIEARAAIAKAMNSK